MKKNLDNLKMVKFDGRSYVVSELPWDVPVVSFSVTQEGECCSFYWAKKWQSELAVMEAMSGAVRQDVNNGFNPTSGFIFGYTHPDNKKVIELVQNLGLSLEEVEKDGEPWIRWYISVEDLRRIQQ